MVDKSGSIKIQDFDTIGIYDEWILDHEFEGYIPKNIGISRLGLCVRQTCLTMSRAKKRDISKVEMENLRRMFRQAKLLEDDWRQAFTKKRILFSYQTPLTEWLPEGWGGFLDFLVVKKKKLKLIEMKATHPNNFKFASSLPKKHNVMQSKGYMYACRQIPLDLEWSEVLYVDRGGQNRPLSFGSIYTKNDEIEVMAEMNRQMMAWQICKKDGTLPDPLHRTLKVKHDKRKHIYEIFLEQDWQCDYCDFCGASCVPDKSRNKVGEFLTDNNQLKMRKGYEEYEESVEETLRDRQVIE